MASIKLKSIDPKNTGKFGDKADAVESTTAYLEEMYRLMYLMFAEDKRSLLIILHGIDAAGKDGAIQHIFSGANPQGIRVYSFKVPSEDELKHDFLWRCHHKAPERGTTAIFNRSYYEDVSTVKVHPEYLKLRKSCEGLDPELIFDQRYQQINNYEKMLTENGTSILKFFLHISKVEQKERLQERLKDSTRNWKFSLGDVKERKHWEKYQSAFQEMINETNTKHCPWHVIPADKKWYRNYLISKAIVEKLAEHKMKFPHLNTKAKNLKI
ncbi:MAG: PPK2 family polyphosphate kinase [Bdellovibrionota bacterium]